MLLSFIDENQDIYESNKPLLAFIASFLAVSGHPSDIATMSAVAFTIPGQTFFISFTIFAIDLKRKNVKMKPASC